MEFCFEEFNSLEFINPKESEAIGVLEKAVLTMKLFFGEIWFNEEVDIEDK